MSGSAESTRPESGFSLVEVIVALGLLSGVLIAVAGLLVIGNRDVTSGRKTSSALAIGRSFLEEVETLGYHQAYELYGGSGDAPTHSVRSDDAGEPEAARWQAELDALLTGGTTDPVAEFVFESVSAPGDPQPNLEDSRGIRVRIRVRWSEGLRQRSVELCMVKL